VSKLLRKFRRIGVVALVPVLAVVMSACGSSSTTSGGGDSSGSGGQITYAVSVGVASIDPGIACNAFWDYVPVKNLYDTLVQYSEERDESGAQKIVPMLAESWDVDPSSKVFTFHLRDDVTFANGDKMTAEDVVYGFDRLVKLGGCQDYVLTLGDPKLIESIKAVDPQTVKFTLSESSPRFLAQLAQTGMSPINKKELEAHGGLTQKGDQWIATHPIGTGAYELTKYEPDSEIVMKSRPDYWQGKPKNSGVSMRIVSDVNTMKTLVQSNQLDMATGLPLKDIDSLATGRQLLADPSQFYIWLGMNNKKAPFTDVKVRQAIQSAVPVAEMADQLGHGHAQSFAGPIPPAMPFYPDLPIPPVDLDKAKQLVSQAGADGSKFTIDIKNGDSLAKDAATVIQSNLADIGIDVSIAQLGPSAFYNKVSTFKSDAYLIKDGAPYNEPAYFLGFLIKCGDPFNWMQYCNKEVDKLLAEGKAETDNSKRAEIYKKISEIVEEEAPQLPIMAPENIVIASNSLKGYVYYDDQQPVFWPISAD